MDNPEPLSSVIDHTFAAWASAREVEGAREVESLLADALIIAEGLAKR